MSKRCKIDLITGFLGAGKTTFLRNYAEYLLKKGENICILENDYGAINVDLVFLQDLLQRGCGLEMVIGGDGMEAHRRRFKTKLISMAMMGYSRILVEPSGIYDVDEFFDTLREEPLDQWYEIGSVIGILDSTLCSDGRELSEESRYVLVSEMAEAGKIVFSKLERDTRERDAQIQNVKDYLHRCFQEFQCNRILMDCDFLEKPWKELTDADFSELERAGYREQKHVKRLSESGNSFQSAFYFGVHDTEAGIRKRIEALFRDPELLGITRVKGCILVDKPDDAADSKEHITEKDSGFRPKTVWKSLEGMVDNRSFLEVNATRESIQFHRAMPTKEVLIIIGEHLPKEHLHRYFPEAREYGMI